ncbi:MAG TPA: thioredoxin [Negativicutes bacterium]
MASVLNVSNANFHEEVIESDKPVLVDFWAPWCGYCSKLAPIFAELATELEDKVKLVTVNVDDNRSLAQQYGVMSLPTMILFKDGKLEEKMTGFMPKAALSTKISAFLA